MTYYTMQCTNNFLLIRYESCVYKIRRVELEYEVRHFIAKALYEVRHLAKAMYEVCHLAKAFIRSPPSGESIEINTKLTN